jgi:addiction module HigA family antidote
MVDKQKEGTYLPDIAISPGETLKEVLESKSITQRELALRMNRPIKTISEIVNGKALITPETAYQLEQVLDIDASFWLNLEADYQITKERINVIRQLRKQIPLVKRFPYNDMSKLGWVKQSRDGFERVSELLSFFGVTDLSRVKLLQKAAFRKSQKYDVSPEALSAWLRKGEIEAMNINTDSYNRSTFKSVLEEIRLLTRYSSGKTFEKLRELCRKCGVALVFTPHLKKTHVNGAARWLDPKKALIQLSIRYRYEDVFWFTFFHEAGHLLLHGKKEEFIDLKDSTSKDNREIQADNFARDILIPPRVFEKFLSMNRLPYSKRDIENLSSELGISPAIVVGRMQHEGLVPHTHLNSLRRKLEWN